MKNWLFLLVAGLVLSAFTGCEKTSARETGSSSAPASQQVEYFFEDESVKIALLMDQAEYTLNNVIHTTVTITNQSDVPIIYIKGSGSNRIPEAMQIELGQLAGLFYPEMMTMDYRVDILNAGESVTFECPFVPYISKEGRKEFGFDKDLSYFQSDEFEPASPGQIEGTVRFHYVVSTAESISELDQVEKGPQITLSGEFSTMIVE